VTAGTGRKADPGTVDSHIFDMRSAECSHEGEPTAALDPRSRWLLVNDPAPGRVGPDELDIVPAIADRAIVLGDDRRVLALGPLGEILASCSFVPT
jgi:hypothetical protein